MGSATATGLAPTRKVMVLLGLTTLLAILFWFGAAFPYLTAKRESFGQFPELYWGRRDWLWLHIAGGSLALFAGPVQLWLGAAGKTRGIHRSLGYVYLFGVALGGAAAFYMSCTTPVGFLFASGLFAMAVASFVTTGMAYAAIRSRNFHQHREWMIRSYVVMFSFVTFRGIVVAMTAAGAGGEGVAGDVLRASFAAWSSWSVPLLAAEFFLQLPKLGPVRR